MIPKNAKINQNYLKAKYEEVFSYLLDPSKYPFIAIALSLLAISVNSSWTFNRYGWLDHYAYLGAAVYFPETLKHFPEHGILELLPTYLPSALLYHFLEPQAANLTRDMFYLSLALFMFMKICDFFTQNSLATALTTIIFVTYYYFLASIGSDYTDSTIQLLCITNFFIITQIIENIHKKKRSNYLAIILGVFSALLFSSGILSIVYILNFLLFFFIYLYLKQETAILKSKEYLQKLFFWLAGILTTIASISVYLHTATGGYYMKFNILKLFGYLGGVFQNPPTMEWLPYAGWLIIPASILIACLDHLFLNHNYYIYSVKQDSPQAITEDIKKIEQASGKTTNSLLTDNKIEQNVNVSNDLKFKQLSLAFTIITVSISMILIQFVVKQWSLQFMYFSQINFIYFIGFSMIISSRLAFSSKEITFLALISILAFFTLHLTTRYALNFELVLNKFPFEAGVAWPWLIIILFFSAALILYARNLASLQLIALTTIAINLFSYSQSFGGFCCFDAYPIKFFGSRGTTSQNAFDCTMRLSNYLDKLDKDRESDIWYDDKELLGQIYRQTFSMNYLNFSRNLINKRLPELGDYSGPKGSEGHAPIASRKLILISENPYKLSIALDNLDKALEKKHEYDTYTIKIGEVDLYLYKTR